ncbi:threonine dehydratase [Flavobacterium branchiophilum]|uniref:L-threonine dehydratase n=1 Tax=Flavobacterium branchiophilum TaxID=55197 RepID=A0A2H3KTC3_9FLAO|nr:threonine ammonia-lyase IlvA [Flavobacterium branchiophilum]OXA79746.1 threonine dehydratase [Flavobacterium branchiophilum] [Flavobacterium branchiophilum NBRC 15030 = ATCC 35035]PDS25688.1 threonine dehydratase [Flavobacterium branchiophilum]TQM41321.1 L-threonine ammonia-lyase [Flavobacterium branchiophilum]GEM56527.1 L-threonine dehydratase [Flavobacterium branchiophilum NBRC 15030 = ATCC 35035]
MNLFKEILQAKNQLKGVVQATPLAVNTNISSEFDANILLKREDLQTVRSYKIRGAYNKMSSLSESEKAQGIVCASAGNHAQGVAFSCNFLKIQGKIYMPKTTPKQKVKQVQLFGKSYVEIVLTGDAFDDAYASAVTDCTENNKVFIHPFDDFKVIAGQGTIGLEIIDAATTSIDFVFVPIGGGGLAAGLSTVFKELSPNTKIIGVEPLGAPSMKTSIANNENTILNTIDKFVDGAAVKQVGQKTFEICKETLHDIVLVPEGKVCTTILRLYNEEAMVVEPAGALTIAALDFYKDQIKGKNVVCIVSGSNNDIERTAEIKERSLLYEGLMHYFMIQFPQRPGSLKEFVNHILGDDDDITYFQFAKKTNREMGSVVVGLELKNRNDIESIKQKMTERGFPYQYLNDKQELYTQIVG